MLTTKGNVKKRLIGKARERLGRCIWIPSNLLTQPVTIVDGAKDTAADQQVDWSHTAPRIHTDAAGV